ncbi:AraC-type DNA-binding protein [Paenibacillus sp. 1_12]|uniref:helix-turn-helix domain-containing protein n=1 Tax=Paenibacillus sp. 1_12 TaxID=1566278 RepID=UPI0008E7FBE0|nr:helix-turn-helix domain-containing protein [Paenibacillus sp. 1_12]SFM22926.1 AraC-type DNA-binding protein [Paenibacillus sp. 1_12]
MSWNLTGQEPYWQDVIPNPCVNLVIQKNRTGIYGAAKYKYSQLLESKGCVFGVKFKPGGFYPFIKKSVAVLATHPMDIYDVFDVKTLHVEDAILTQEDASSMVEKAESFIRPKLPERDETVALINQIIDRIVEEREITKVDDICAIFAINKRQLQRIFDQYVGINPKWVIKLYRLQNAAETIDHDKSYDRLKLSAALGYHDQSHFIKDFKSIIGITPDAYAKQ